MRLKAVRLQLLRRARRQRRQAAATAEQTGRSMERYFFGRFEKFGKVWRFVTAWLVLFILLIGAVVAQNTALGSYYQTLRPVPGGIYEEGILGTFTNANPIYATNDVDLAVSHLIFAGLLSYSSQNRLVGDLASKWKVDSTGELYTVTLRPNLTWQDGQPLTANDVAYTYHTIQNPDAESPLRDSWAGITVTATGPRTVTFKLPNPLSSFVYNLTNGIVPAHLLKDIPATGLRSATFNTGEPIGAGPFMWHDIQVSGSSPSDAQVQIGLLPFDHYWDGQPKLKTFTVNAFARTSDMLQAYRDKQLNAMAGLDSVPADIASRSDTVVNNFTLTAAEMVFFRTDSGVLANTAVRQALIAAANPATIIARLGYVAPPVREPLLRSQFPYNAKYAQLTNRPAVAAKTLDKAGWKLSADGIRRDKKGQELGFTLVAPDKPEARIVAAQLKSQWRRVGVVVTAQYDDDDSFHNALLSQNYDSVLYGISIGVDPDVYVYWDSSQNDVRSANHLNLSDYSSPTADTSLEAGRTRTGDVLRNIKYQPFLKAWQADAPALGLYQPRFLYVSRGQIYGLQRRILNTATDRYDNVNDWMIRTAGVTNGN